LKVPKLVKVIDLHDLVGILTDKREYSEIKSIRLLRSCKGNIVLTFDRRYIVPPYVLLSSTSRNIRIIKVVNRSSSISSSVLSRLAVPNQELNLGDYLYFKSTGHHISLCDSSGRCYDIANEFNIQYSNYLGNPIMVICSKRYCIYNNPINSKLVKVKNAVLGIFDSTACLIASNGEVHDIYIWDRFEGGIKAYTYEREGMKFNKLICGERLCVAYSKSEALAISFYSVYPIPTTLKPLISCGHNDYFIDERYGIVIKSKKGELDPIAVTGTAIPCGAVGDTPVISTQAGVGVVNDKILLILRPGRYLQASAYHDIIAVRHGGKVEFIVYEGNEEYSSIANVTKCVAGREGLAWCLSNSDLVVLNPKEAIRAEIKVLNSEISAREYAVISLSPWFNGSSYEVSKSVNVVEAVENNERLILKLRPKRLGWSGSVRIVLRTPIITLSENFDLSSTRPKLGSIRIIDCKYSPDGILKNLAGSDKICNTYIKVKVKISNPTPESGLLKIRSSDFSELSGNEFEIPVEPGDIVRSIILSTFSKHGRLELSFNLSFQSGDQYYLGKLAIDLKKFMVPNPLKDVDVILTHVGNETILSLRDSNAVLRLTCYDGRTFEGIGSISVSECPLPAVLLLEAQDDFFTWKKYITLNDLIDKPRIFEGSLNSEEVLNVSHTPSRKGGFIFNNLKVHFQVGDNGLIKNVNFDFISLDKLAINYEVRLPSLVIAVCGNDVKYAESKSGSLVINAVTDCFIKGIKIIALGPAGITQCLLIPPSKLLNALLALAARTSLKLGKYLGVCK